MQRAFLEDEKISAQLADTTKVDDVDPSAYDAVVLVGGHGTMWDFPDSAAAQKAIREIDAAGGIVSAVCHGPAALVDARRADGSLLVAGKRVAAFTNGEEEEVGLTKVVPFLVEDELMNLGAIFSKVKNWGVHTVTDGQLITGQNPASSGPAAEVLLEVLNTRVK